MSEFKYVRIKPLGTMPNFVSVEDVGKVSITMLSDEGVEKYIEEWSRLFRIHVSRKCDEKQDRQNKTTLESLKVRSK